jgi:hypothetical protein
VTGRLLALLAVIVSLVGFIADLSGTNEWWVYAVGRGSYVLVALALVAALLARRSLHMVVVLALVLSAAAALGCVIVALVKYYATTLDPVSLHIALAWAVEAQVFAVAALAFGLTLTRGRNTGAMVWLAAAVVMALGCATYAITQKYSPAAYMWWTLATVGAFLAGSAAAVIERPGTVASGVPVAPVPPVLSGTAASDPRDG